MPGGGYVAGASHDWILEESPWKTLWPCSTRSRSSGLMMTSKERLLSALRGEKPDRLPVSVHQWQPYHLDTYLGGISDLEAFARFGMDAQIQYFESMGQFWLVDADFTKSSTPEWRDEVKTVSATTRTTASSITPSTRPKAYADLQDGRRPQDHVDHRVPDQARRGHRADPQIHARARRWTRQPIAEALRRGRRRGHPARIRLGRPGGMLAARLLPGGHQRSDSQVLRSARLGPRAARRSCWRRSCSSSNR